MKDEIVRGELPSEDRAAQMTRLLLENFPEQEVLRYQQHLAEAGLREVVLDVRRSFAVAVRDRGSVPRDLQELADGLLNLLDPDHPDSEGPYPSSLVRS